MLIFFVQWFTSASYFGFFYVWRFSYIATNVLYFILLYLFIYFFFNSRFYVSKTKKNIHKKISTCSSINTQFFFFLYSSQNTQFFPYSKNKNKIFTHSSPKTLNFLRILKKICILPKKHSIFMYSKKKTLK